jgi:hypothetical protein
MRVHDLIGAFYAIDTFRLRAEGLREHYGPGTAARLALDDALSALDRFGDATAPRRPGPGCAEAAASYEEDTAAASR